jgi:uncharacterized protein (TIGR03435 family)
MERFAARLSRYPDIGRLVADKTGLAGGYDFELEWLPERAGLKPETTSSGDLPSIFVAIQEKLGLKLESARVTIESIVIDHAEKPEGN